LSAVKESNECKQPKRTRSANNVKLSTVLAKMNVMPVTQTKGYNVYIADTALTGQTLAKALLTSCKKPIGFDIGMKLRLE